MTNNTIPNVPRELLERARAAVASTNTSNWSSDLLRDIHAILSAPSPAGVDGCKCSMSISMLGDGCRHCQPQEYIDRIGEMLDEERSELSDAQAIIDGLRGEVGAQRIKTCTALKERNDAREERDQQARRIGELKGLLLRVQVSLSLDDTEWGYSGAEKYKLLADIRAALSAGKDSVS